MGWSESTTTSTLLSKCVGKYVGERYTQWNDCLLHVSTVHSYSGPVLIVRRTEDEMMSV